MVWSAVPAKITGELPAVKVPPLMKLPLKVNPKFVVARIDPELMFSGAELEAPPKILASFKVMVPVPLTATPPEAIKVASHSGPAVKGAGLLY